MKILKYKKTGFLILGIFFSSQLYSEIFFTDLQYKILDYHEVKRSVYLHLPENLNDKKKLPVVFVLHGGGNGDGDDIAKFTAYQKIANREGFLVVYPNGLDSQWNDGRGKTFRKEMNSNIDDVGFISMLIDLVIKKYNGDQSRIYITGISNGGMMTFRLGCEISSKLAAIAPVIANMPVNIINQCKPDSTLPVMIMNGTDDPLVPWDGGEVTFFRWKMGKVVSTKKSVQFWVTHNKCSFTPIIHSLKNSDTTDHSTVTVTRYNGNKNECDVILYSIIGGGHNFPGSTFPEFPRITGRKNNDINGAEVIWSFFKIHKRE